MTKDDVLDRASWRWLKDRVVTLERELEARDARIRELERQVTNLTSTVEAWNHAEIIKCGCKYNKVWGGMKWEHWLSPCKEHREREQQLKAAQERLAEVVGELEKVHAWMNDDHRCSCPRGGRGCDLARLIQDTKKEQP